MALNHVPSEWASLLTATRPLRRKVSNPGEAGPCGMRRGSGIEGQRLSLAETSLLFFVSVR
jgi:hypothetical protein